MPGTTQDNGLYLSGLNEDKFYKKAKNIRRGSVNTLYSKCPSLEQKANLARFIESTMKRKPKKTKPPELSAQVSATDLILKRAFLNAWEAANLIRRKDSTSLDDYLAQHANLYMSVTIPPFEANIPLSKDAGLLQRSYTGDVMKSRIPFKASPRPSPENPFQAYVPLTHSNRMPSMTRPQGIEGLSIVIPLSPSGDTGGEIYMNCSNEPVSMNSGSLEQRLVPIDSFVMPYECTAPTSGSTDSKTAQKTKGRRNSIISNIASFDLPPKLKQDDEFGKNSMTCTVQSARCTSSAYLMPSLKTTVPFEQTPPDPTANSTVFSSETTSINGSSLPLKNVAPLNSPQTAASVVTPLGSTESFWKTWNQYANVAGGENLAKNAQLNARRRVDNKVIVVRFVSY